MLLRRSCVLLAHFAPSRAISCSPAALKLRRRRTIFFGNDAFSLTHLRTLHQLFEADSGLLSSLCVTTSSPRSPVFKFARSNGLRTVLWADVGPDLVAQYDVGVVASFGHLLPKWLLDKIQVVNVHPSLLPRWRGSAPVLHTVLRGDAAAGVTLMLVHPHHFDRGPLMLQEAVPVPEGVRARQLSEQLAQVGQRLLTQALVNLPQFVSHATLQPSEGATVARKVSPRDAVLDWSLSTSQIDRLDRSVGDLLPLTSTFAGLPVALRGFASPAELRELSLRVPLPPALPPGTPFFNKRAPEVVFVRCAAHWTAFRSIRIGRSVTAQRWLSGLEFHNGYLAKPHLRGAVFASNRNPLFRRKEPPAPTAMPAVER